MVHSAVFVVGAVVGALMVIAGGVFFPVFDKIIHDEVVKVSLLDTSTPLSLWHWQCRFG